MIAGGGNKLPFGNIPRLLLAWVTTEAVRTQSRELVLGRSLSEFMGKLGMDSVGGARTRLRNQMRRLFNAHVQLVYEDKLGDANAVIGTAGSFFTSTEGSLSMQPHEQDDTGVDVGSNETGSARTSVDPGRPGRLRGRCLAARGLAAGLLVAVAGLLALPLQAQAQSKILVSNVGLPNNSGSGSLIEFDQAQAFTTGSNSDGYTLRSVEIDIGASSGEYATVFTVSIHSNSSGTPGASLGTLSNPASVSRDGVYAFTTRGIALAASTTYFVVIDAVAISGLQIYINNTSSNAQDPGKAPGWSIGDGSLYRDWDSSGSWTSFHDSKQIRVKGYNPTVINANIEIADASAAENAGHLLFGVLLSRTFQRTVKVDFETISGGTATEGVDYWPHDYTHVILAGDRTAQMGFALIDDTVAAAGETVKVRISNARVVDAYGNVVSFLDITTAEATGTINAPTTTTTNVPGLTIRIKDATGDEDNGYLDFNVRLSRKHDDYVCYDFETISGGTAEEGTDYLKFPKATYWMQIGKRVDKPFVRIIDDSVNDNGETVKVKISNARLCNDPSQTLSITRAEATGTIRNTDPLPQAFRFSLFPSLVSAQERVQETRLLVQATPSNRAEATPGVGATLPLFPVDRGGGGPEAALDFAHFANGDGTTSDLVFVNVLYFYDREGNPIAAESLVDVTGHLEITEDGGLTAVQTQMEPLGVLTISTHGQGPLVSGSVRVVSDGPIGGLLRFEHPGVGAGVVGASLPLSDALFPVRRQEGGITTGVALHNLESSPALLLCDLMREGVLLDAASIPLEANGQTSWLIDQAFPAADTSDFAGSVRCDAVGEGLFSAVALEMDPATRTFITLPVVPVPEPPSQE